MDNTAITLVVRAGLRTTVNRAIKTFNQPPRLVLFSSSTVSSLAFNSWNLILSSCRRPANPMGEPRSSFRQVRTNVAVKCTTRRLSWMNEPDVTKAPNLTLALLVQLAIWSLYLATDIVYRCSCCRTTIGEGFESLTSCALGLMDWHGPPALWASAVFFL